MEENRVLLVTTRTQGENERKVYLRATETRSLIDTLGLQIVYEKNFTLKASFFGKGQIEEICEIATATDATDVIVDTFLSPREEMKLEGLTGLPVSDREALILSIFRVNAHSKEARLQTLKAEAVYLKPRLVFREANYSQQRGGVRGAKGEGEKAIELKRREIDSRIVSLEREIKEIKKTREIQHKRREKNGVFSFALTGYTNSGKTTILKSLSSSSPEPEDRLFATLDTTSRLITLPSGREVILSDTVGFISNLPHSLIEAFSSTLEEALNSDRIIIVADCSHPDSTDCFRTTLETLKSLGAEDRIGLVVINKTDSPYDDISLSALRSSGYPSVETSFKDGKGREELISAIDRIAGENYSKIKVLLPYTSPLFSSLSNNRAIINAEYREDGILVEAEVRKAEEGRYLPYTFRQ